MNKSRTKFISLILVTFSLQSCSLGFKEGAYVLKPPTIGGADDLYEYKTYTEQDAVKYWPRTGPRQGETLNAALEEVAMGIGYLGVGYVVCGVLEGLFAVAFGSEWNDYAARPVDPTLAPYRKSNGDNTCMDIFEL